MPGVPDAPTPDYNQDPLFSSKFRALIVTGTFFVYLNNDNKQEVGRILGARKAVNGYEVTSNIFLPFSDWQSPKGKQHPIEEGLAKDLSEIFLTPQSTKYFSFEDNVLDIAFVFT